MKVCKKCGDEKDLSDYYNHKGMKDGHLNICKSCTLKRVSDYGKSERGREVDKRRGMKESRRRWQRAYSKKMNKKYSKKRKCRSLFWARFRKGLIEKTPCENCGETYRVEAHHSDYNHPFKINWLCSKCHKKWHRENEVIN